MFNMEKRFRNKIIIIIIKWARACKVKSATVVVIEGQVLRGVPASIASWWGMDQLSKMQKIN